jgi:DNA-binding beta-propeller fold protein YncE
MSSPVVLVGSKNYDAVHPYLTRDYVKRTYRQIWWPDQGYFGFTWQRFVDTIRDPVKMKNIFNIVFYRRYADSDDPTKPRDLTKWPNRHEFEMWVRKDIAEQIWDLNVTPIQSVSNQQEQVLQQKTVDPQASGVIAGQMGDKPLLQPRAVAVGPDGSAYIADSGNHRIVIVDKSGNFVKSFGNLCKMAEGASSGCVDPDGNGPLQLGDGQFQEPWGVAVGPDGSIFVADTWNGRIQVFDKEGKFLRKWGYFNTTNGALGDPLALFGPRGLAIDKAGNLLVADTGNKRILDFTPTGDLVTQVGGGGVQLGNFQEPTDVAVDPRDGSIYVADAWNKRIQKFDAKLQSLAEWPVPSWGSQNLYQKPYLAVAGNGDVYATDPENYRVIVYNSAGGVKAAFGSFGAEMNHFGLPNGVAWNPQTNTLYVVDADNQRVMDFAALQ